jgi:hypothetical protein
MVSKWVDLDPAHPFTVGELFDLVLWAWNAANPREQKPRLLAQKMLAGRQRKEDIGFGSLHAFLNSNSLPSNISTSQQPNISTPQDIYLYSKEEGGPHA